MTDNIAISVDDLRKKYKRGVFRRKVVDALQGVSFDVKQGEIFGLLGPNGAGKTTLIKILLGIVRRSGGNARVLGATAGDRRGRERVGYLPENHRIPRHLTGETALEYYGQLSRMPLREIKAKRQQLLEVVGLGDWGQTPVKNYSKGMQQRLGLAQAMLHDPDLLILDEPTDGVDPVGRADIRKTLFMLKAQGKTIFLNSHLLQELELVCDRVAILQNGKLRHVGPIQELTEAAASDLKIRVTGSLEVIRAALTRAPHFNDSPIESIGDSHVVSLKASDQSSIDTTIDALRSSGISIQSMSRDRLTLEQVFLQMIEQDSTQPTADAGRGGRP